MAERLIPDSTAPFSTTRLIAAVPTASWGGNFWKGAIINRVPEGDSTHMTLVTKGPTDGDAHLVLGYPFVKGKRYRATLDVRTVAPLLVSAFARRDVGYLETQGVTCQRVDGSARLVLEWEHRTNDAASLRLALDVPGDLWIDSTTIDEINGGALCPVRCGPVPAELFGIHSSKLGQHSANPSLRQGLVRLWDAGALWADMEKVKGEWSWTRPDLFAKYAVRCGLTVLFPLGFPPAWASSKPDGAGTYGPGSNYPPRSEAEYRNYVRTVAMHFRGVVRHWELGNEMDMGTHWAVSPVELVNWARITREELLAVDPRNQLVGPTIAGGGLLWLAQFYAAGGGQFVDIVGAHGYWGSDPESLTTWLMCIRRIAADNGLADLPVWSTEGAPTNDPAAGFSVYQQRAIVARGLLAMVACGIEGFGYYTMEGTPAGWGLAGPDFITPSQCGESFACIAGWTRGWWVADCLQAGGVFVLKLRQDGRRRYIVWRPAGTLAMRVPPAWGVISQQPLCGYIQPVTDVVSVGIEPLMLE